MPVKAYKAERKPQLDDDLTSSFGNDFKFPRIEGIDDVEEKPCKKDTATQLGNALLGKSSYAEQAEDIIAETFDQDQAQMAARKKQQQLLAQEEQEQQDDLFDEALGKFGAARRSTVKNEATEM